MRICFATGEKQPIANPTVKLLFLHSGCCFEVVGTALFMLAYIYIYTSTMDPSWDMISYNLGKLQRPHYDLTGNHG